MTIGVFSSDLPRRLDRQRGERSASSTGQRRATQPQQRRRTGGRGRCGWSCTSRRASGSGVGPTGPHRSIRAAGADRVAAHQAAGSPQRADDDREGDGIGSAASRSSPRSWASRTALAKRAASSDTTAPCCALRPRLRRQPIDAGEAEDPRRGDAGSTSRTRPEAEEALVERCIGLDIPTQVGTGGDRAVEPALRARRHALHDGQRADRGDRGRADHGPDRLRPHRQTGWSPSATQSPKPLRDFHRPCRGASPSWCATPPTALIRLLDAIDRPAGRRARGSWATRSRRCRRRSSTSKLEARRIPADKLTALLTRIGRGPDLAAPRSAIPRSAPAGC